MKNLIKKLIKSLLLLTMILTFTVANAQARYVPKSETDISITILNLTQPTDRTIEFDVYLLDTDPSQTFQLTTVQLGLLINSDIYTGGTLSGSYVNANSGLLAVQQPSASVSIASTLSGYPNQTLLRLASRTPPGAGNGSMISSTAPGTLMTHLKITSTVPWIANSKANIIFTPSSAITPLYATAVAEYISGTGTPLVITPGVNAIVCCNPDLNKTTQISNSLIGTDYKIYSASKNIYVNCNKMANQIFIYDGIGKLVMMGNKIAGLKKFDLSDKPNAYYLVKIVTDGGIYSQKTLLK